MESTLSVKEKQWEAKFKVKNPDQTWSQFFPVILLPFPFSLRVSSPDFMPIRATGLTSLVTDLLSPLIKFAVLLY